MRDTGHDTLQSMAAAIRADPSGPLANRVVDELLNQESSFFRDAPVFDSSYPPELVASATHIGEGDRVATD